MKKTRIQIEEKIEDLYIKCANVTCNNKVTSINNELFKKSICDLIVDDLLEEAFEEGYHKAKSE